MVYLPPLLAALGLGACAADADLASVQRDCALPSSTVAGELACTRARIGPAPRLADDVAAWWRAYLAYGDALAARVEAGRVTQIEARQDLHVMFQRLRIETPYSHPYWFYWLWPS